MVLGGPGLAGWVPEVVNLLGSRSLAFQNIPQHGCGQNPDISFLGTPL